MGNLKIAKTHADGTSPVGYATRRGQILYGDPNFVNETIANSTCSAKTAYTHLIWNWGNHKPNQKEVKSVLVLLNKSLFAGLNIDEFAACVVLHTDGGKCKNQHHLHIIVASHHFASGRNLDLYSHKRDMGLYKSTVALINHKFGWEQPCLARKRKISDEIADLWHLTNLRDNSLPEPVQAFKQSTIEDCIRALARGDVRTREDIEEYLTKQGYEVKAKEKYLAVSHPGLKALGFTKNVRLKGEMFEQGFKFDDSKRNRTGQARYTETEIAAIKADYTARVQTRRERHQKRFKVPTVPGLEMTLPATLTVQEKSAETPGKTPEPTDFQGNQKSEITNQKDYTDEHHTRTDRGNLGGTQTPDFGTHIPTPNGVRGPRESENRRDGGRAYTDREGLLNLLEGMRSGRRRRKQRNTTDTKGLTSLWGTIGRTLADLLEAIAIERLRRRRRRRTIDLNVDLT